MFSHSKPDVRMLYPLHEDQYKIEKVIQEGILVISYFNMALLNSLIFQGVYLYENVTHN